MIRETFGRKGRGKSKYNDIIMNALYGYPSQSRSQSSYGNGYSLPFTLFGPYTNSINCTAITGDSYYDFKLQLRFGAVELIDIKEGLFSINSDGIWMYEIFSKKYEMDKSCCRLLIFDEDRLAEGNQCLMLQ